MRASILVIAGGARQTRGAPARASRSPLLYARLHAPLIGVDLFDRPRSASARNGGREAREETLEGTVERIVFTGGEGDFTVARLKPSAGGEVVTIVGSLPGVPVGASLRVRRPLREHGALRRAAARSRATPRSRRRRSTASAATWVRA